MKYKVYISSQSQRFRYIITDDAYAFGIFKMAESDIKASINSIKKKQYPITNYSLYTFITSFNSYEGLINNYPEFFI